MGRSHICPKTGLKRGAWAQDEDHLLASYVKRYGHCNWRELPKKAGLLRCGKSCRLRWMNYLRPNIKRGNYTKEEDELIIKLHEKLGNKWSIIAANLPGRTDNEIKNHWHCDLKHSPTTKEAMKNKKLKQCETAVGSEASFEFDSNIWSEPFDMDEWCVPEEPSAQCETIGEVNTSTPQFMESSGFLRSSPGVENLSSFDDADSWSGHFQMDDLCTPGGAPSIMGFPPSPQCETAVGSEARFEFDSNIWSEPFDMDVSGACQRNPLALLRSVKQSVR